MAYGDTNYKWLNAGSTGTATCAIHNLFGSYSGLSLLTNDDVVRIQLQAFVNDMLVGPTTNLSNNIGYRITAALSWVDLPPMRVGDASQLQLFRANGVGTNFAVSANNASAMWVIWSRIP